MVKIKNQTLQGRQAKPFACVLLVGLSLLLSVTSHSQTYVGPIPNTDLKHGRVMARSIVVDPATGEPILVEYNADGTEAGEVDIGGASVADVSILPAADYRFYQTQLAGYQEQYKDTLALGAEVYWRTKFSQAVFVAADGQTVITQEVLPEGVNSVLVRGQSNRLLPDPAQLVLLSFPLDMSQDIAVSDNSVSLVVDINGRILAQSENNIGYRTGFFGDPNDPQDDRGSQVGEDDTVFGPIQGVKVSVDEFAYRGGADVTNSEGAYSFLFYMPPCPVGGFSFTTDVWAELRYKNFLPGGSPSIPYYLRTPGYSDCYASLYPGFGGSVPAPNTFSNFQSNLYADVMFVTGRIKLRALDGSEIEVGDTTYTAFETPANATTQNHYDFNGDGRSDFVVRGRVDTQTNDEGDEVDVFIADQDNGDLQGIFFDGSQEDEFDLPDLVRLIDTELRNEPIGVLKSISSADLRNTDVLFFRESTGQLIMERRGLKEEESEYRRAVQYDDEKNEVAYRIMLRGPSDSALNVGGGVRRDASYTEWATQNQLTEPFLKKLSDSPRPGEFIKIVAINRATGYTGTQRVQLLSAGDNSTGQLDVAVEPITLAPPNLKIWAERNYEVEHGLTKGEDRTYTIGSEGAALTSDKTITIYTEWLDEAGAPLPDELSLDDGEQYGLTGRLAKVVTTNTLQGVGAGSDLAEFPIAGGRKTQVIKVGDNLTTAQHFYIHVHGKPKDQECVSDASCPDFSMGSDEPGFEGRPQLITPFLTPLGDEDKHWQEYNAYRGLQREAEDDPDAIEPTRPLPAYAWQYRPEYQFSQFDLEIDELNRTTKDEDGNETTVNILDADNPLIASGDELITALYSLISSDFERLAPIDGTQELVLALGEQEQRITIGEDQTITFDNVESLGSLDPEDFLTIRLYTNNDAGNILWEYAFLYLNIGISEDKGVIYGEDIAYVNADENVIEIATTLIGYASLNDEVKQDYPDRIRWRILSGDASVSSSTSSIDEAGVSVTSLTVLPRSDNLVKVEASLVGDNSTKVQMFDIGVIPGQPASISTIKSGTAYIKDRGLVTLSVTVKDQHNNLVTNGTGVDIIVSGHSTLRSTTGITNNGVVTAKISGGSVAGSYPIRILSGNAQTSATVSIASLEVQVTDIPTQIVAGNTYALNAVVSGISGDLSGIFVDVGASAGSIDMVETRTNASGVLPFTYTSPNEIGAQTISAKVDLNLPMNFPIDVISAGDTGTDDELNADHGFLVSGVQAGTNQATTDYLGNAVSINHAVNTLNISGQADDSWEINLDDRFFINREPAYFSRFSSLKWDELHRVSASFENVVRKGGAPHRNLYALDFIDETSKWFVDRLDDADFDEPSYNFHIKPVAPGKILDVAGGAIELSYQSSGSLTAKVKTNLGTVSLSQDNIVAGQWYKLAVGVFQGEFYLLADGTLITEPTNGGTITYAANTADRPWLTFGDGFTGTISGLSIYNWQSDPLIALTTLSGVFDADGNAQAELLLSQSAVDTDIQLPSVSVALALAGSNDKININVLNGATVEQFAALFAGVYSASNVAVDEVITAMSLDGIYPMPKRSVVSLMRRFSGTSSTDSMDQTVAASLGWIMHEPRYAVLHDKVEALQRYFLNSGMPQLAEFALEYFQEAVVDASEGSLLRFRALSTSLVVWAELLAIRPDIADKIAQSIQSRDDFWVWLRVMSLPANGWATDVVPIPRAHMTCDKVKPDVNQGTLFEYSLTPCRATGAQMAALLELLIEGDESLQDDPHLLSTYVSTLVASLKEMPIEFKRLFPAPSNSVASNDQFNLVPEAQAAFWVYGFRALAITLKQAIRKGTGGAPANFIAFLQGGTTSRVRPTEMLTALAYLGSRLDGTNFCDDCPRLKKQVSDTVKADMAQWFAGIGLAKDGAIINEDEVKKSCTLTGNTHGKAFELLGTAAYHALFEFGGSLGVPNPAQYEILLSDPRANPNVIHVGLMQKKSENSSRYRFFDGSPHQRKPDLVLEGDGVGKRQWIEFKSWRYNKSYINKTNGRVSESKFPKWDGQSKNENNFRRNAHRQYFLDTIASQDTLVKPFWEGHSKGKPDLKPNKHKTWMQIWKAEKRTWRKLVKGANGKYTLSSVDKITRNVATPWIDSSGIITSVPKNFRELQRFLNAPPKGINAQVFEDSMGMSLREYQNNYLKNQLSDNVAELSTANVAPFNLLSFFAIEGGDQATDLLAKLLKEFANEAYAELQAAVESGNITATQVDQLRQKITDLALENLGALKYLTIDLWLISDIENGVVDLVVGEEIEKAREFIADFQFPEKYFENLCEAN